MRIGIMGLGEIGTANKHYLKSLGLEVVGYDPKYHPDFNLPKCNAYIICPSSDRILDACKLIKEIDPRATLLVESTAKIGTTGEIFDLFDGEATVIYCPQRYWEKDPEGRGVRRHRLIGAFTEQDLAVGITWYLKIFDIPVYPVTSPEVAEFSKFVENTYRGVQIAFAQEVKMYADREGLDFDEVRGAIMTASPMHYLPDAIKGVGGHCIPMAMDWTKDEMSIVSTALVSNELYKNYIESKKNELEKGESGV